MLGIFIKSRQLLLISNNIGESIHRQVLRGLEIRGTIFDTTNEIVFFVGYLDSFIELGFKNQENITSRVQLKYIKYICNGVLPKKLWDYYTRGQVFMELSQEGKRPEFIDAQGHYGLGRVAGVKDADLLLNKQTNSENLLRVCHEDCVSSVC